MADFGGISERSGRGVDDAAASARGCGYFFLEMINSHLAFGDKIAVSVITTYIHKLESPTVVNIVKVTAKLRPLPALVVASVIPYRRPTRVLCGCLTVCA